MKFNISRSQYGDKIYYIARDSSGVVRLRADTMKRIEKEIEEFNKREESSKPQKNLHEVKGHKAEEKSAPSAEVSADLSVEETDIEEPKEEKATSASSVAKTKVTKKFYGYRRGK